MRLNRRRKELNLMTSTQAAFCWFIGMDGAFLTVIAVRLCLISLPSLCRSAYFLSYALAITLLAIVAIWDIAHPHEQFPYTVRMWITVPLMLLGTFGLAHHVWNAGKK